MLISRFHLSALTAMCLGIAAVSAQTPAAGDEAKLIAVLQSNADDPAKAAACRELGHTGTAAAIPALAALLANESLSHMARYGLETLPSPEVDAALRDALAKLKGRTLIGVIGSLGVRHDPKAVPALAKLLLDADAGVAQASARALGQIATDDAVKTLQDALAKSTGANQLAVCQGLLSAAERLASLKHPQAALAIYDNLRKSTSPPHQVAAAAWRGAILTGGNQAPRLLGEALRSTNPGLAAAALRIGMELQDPAATAVIAAEFTKAKPARQVELAGLLGKRADPAALPVLIDAAKAGDTAARIAAIKALAEIGDATATAPLFALLGDADGTVAQAANSSLAGLPGPEVDATLLGLLATTEGAMKPKLLDVVRQRRIAKAMPALLQLSNDNDPATRAAAIRACSEIATEKEIPALLEKLTKATEPADIDAAEKALNAACASAKDPKSCVPQLAAGMAKANTKAKPAFVKSLHAIGGPDALTAVRSAVDDPDKDVHTAAIRTLGEWKSAEAAPVLLELAKSSATPVDKILSLRGYLAMAGKNDVAPADKLTICRNAAPMIQRDDEKLLLLGTLANLGNPESLDLAAAYLTEPAVQREAVTTVLNIAGKRQPNQHVALTRGTLQKLVSVAANNPDATKQANELLKKMENEK